MIKQIKFRVEGVPGPQGSKSRGRGDRMYESSKKVKPWRDAIQYAVMLHPQCRGSLPIIRGAVALSVTFMFLKPKTATRKYPAVAPDIDKLLRSTCDALTMAGVWEDDSRVVDLHASKRYSDWQGAVIRVAAMEEK